MSFIHFDEWLIWWLSFNAYISKVASGYFWPTFVFLPLSTSFRFIFDQGTTLFHIFSYHDTNLIINATLWDFNAILIWSKRMKLEKERRKKKEEILAIWSVEELYTLPIVKSEMQKSHSA